jgi:hypothetical protein
MKEFLPATDTRVDLRFGVCHRAVVERRIVEPLFTSTRKVSMAI